MLVDQSYYYSNITHKALHKTSAEFIRIYKNGQVLPKYVSSISPRVHLIFFWLLLWYLCRHCGPTSHFKAASDLKKMHQQPEYAVTLKILTNSLVQNIWYSDFIPDDSVYPAFGERQMFRRFIIPNSFIERFLFCKVSTPKGHYSKSRYIVIRPFGITIFSVRNNDPSWWNLSE